MKKLKIHVTFTEGILGTATADPEIYSRFIGSKSPDAATNTGICSAATNTGDRSAATNTGNCSAATVEGKESIAIVTGNGSKASGKRGCWLVLTERDKENHVLGVQAVKVDGETIKEDTFYTLSGGKVTEVK